MVDLKNQDERLPPSRYAGHIKPGFGDHLHNDLITPFTDRQWRRAIKFIDIVGKTLET